ncbi:MAG: hypothetical protein RMX65_004060 [Nostoc sp. DedQUE01]
MNSKIAKLLFPTVAGTVIGFSTILASLGTAFALQSTVITSPNTHAISNVVLYLQDSSGNFIKVKVDNFSDVPQETTTYNPTNVLQNYSGYTLVAYTVKAGDNKSKMGPGEGELVIVDSEVQAKSLPTGSATYTYEYKAIYSSTTATSTTSSGNESTTTSSADSNFKTFSSETSDNTQSAPIDESTVVSSELGSDTQSAPADKSTFVSSNNAEITQPVSVPEPGTITALALFGLGGVFAKKKLKSSDK